MQRTRKRREFRDATCADGLDGAERSPGRSRSSAWPARASGRPGRPPWRRRAARGRRASSGRGRAARRGVVSRRSCHASQRNARAEHERRDDVDQPELPTRTAAASRATSTTRVEDDLPRRLALAAHDRQHRHARRLVVAPDQQRERPEVRRRPDEDDQEERRAPAASGSRSPRPSRRAAAPRRRRRR